MKLFLFCLSTLVYLASGQKNEFWDDLLTEGWFVYKTDLPGFTIQEQG